MNIYAFILSQEPINRHPHVVHLTSLVMYTVYLQMSKTAKHKTNDETNDAPN